MIVTKVSRGGAALLAVALTGGAAAGAQESEREIGRTVLVEPRVTRQGLQEAEEKELEVGLGILLEDTVQGDEDSEALLLIEQLINASVHLSGKSTMRLTLAPILSADQCGTDEAAGQMFAIEAEGSLRFLVAEALAGCDLEVHTDRAVVFIHGSDVRLWAQPDVALIAVVEGRATVRARDDRGRLGPPVVVTAGHSTLVREGRPPTFPAPFGPADPLAPPGPEPPYDEPPQLPQDPALPIPRPLPPIP